MSTNRRKQQARQRGAQQRAAVRSAGNGPPSCSPGSQVEFAREVDVSRQSASRWHARWPASGAPGLWSRGPTGRRPKIADDQLEAIEQALLEAHWRRVRH